MSEALPNLEPFLCAARCGSFAAAADQLGLTPPAVSKSVARLEDWLGVRLFDRTTRKLGLTPEGMNFLQRVTPMLDGLRHAVDDLRETGAQPKGLLRVACGSTLGQYWLLPRLQAFLERYPDVNLTLDLDDEPHELLERGADVGIRQGYWANSTLVVRRLPIRFRVLLMASPKYLARCGEPRTLEELWQHGSIGLAEPSRRFAAWKLHRVSDHGDTTGVPLAVAPVPLSPGRVNFAGTHCDACLMATLQHLGISAISWQAALPFLQSGQLKVVMPGYEVRSDTATDNHLYVQYAYSERLSPKVRAFVDFVLGLLDEEQEDVEQMEHFGA